MSERAKCPKCGSELPADAPGDLCPNCLLATGLKSQSADDPYAEHLAATAADGSEDTPASANLEPGQQFGGYRIIRRLGRGGMGAVYEAENLESRRRVALKLLGHSFDSPDARKRFLREGRLAAAINHPNSVYVYGTEEIERTPAISMELVAGGTLERRVRHDGPLPIAEAVDAILEVISGLEAAQEVGVLHRDVKPANCFIDPEGTVKVGDFGLSISTAPRGDSIVTVEGTFLGTPAYASPEQLRGDEMDVRSDVYSVGVTLYYLLTGRTPFENKNLVQFLATVLERPAPSPRSLRSEIPKDLARIILRCLEKQPASRYGRYSDLREALLPYSSTAPTAGTLGLRFVASIVDGLIWMCVYLGVCFAWFGDLSPILSADVLGFERLVTLFAVNVTLYSLYYGVFEGLWGATPGKTLCRLRVVDSKGSSPGISRALGRALIWIVLPQLLHIVYVGCAGTEALVGGTGWVAQGIGLSFYVLLAVMFSTARRRNGFAGIHDLATGLRVVARPSYQPRPVSSTQEDSFPDTESMPKIGPYYILNQVDQAADSEFVVGYDVRLLRKVWIRKTAAPVPPVAESIRNQGRPGRVRWLSGKRDSAENWDAYEYLSGQPLALMLDQAQPWELVRYWLADLSEELNAALKNDTLPEVLSLERIWITAGNRAKLLDFRAPLVAEQSASPRSDDDDESKFAAARRFLNQVAIAALEGRHASPSEANQHRAAAPVPLHARTVLDRLPTCPSPSLPAEAFKPMLQMAARISRLRRFGLVLGSVAVPALFAVMFSFVGLFYHQWQQSQPEVATLRHCLFRLQLLEENSSSLTETQEEQRRDLGIYIATQLRETFLDERAMSTAAARALILPEQRAIAEEAMATYEDVSQMEIENSMDRMRPILAEPRTITAGILPKFLTLPVLMAIIVGEMLLVFVILPSLFLALVSRGGALIHTLGIAIVTKRGARASRLRTFWRSLIAWSPILGLPVLLVFEHFVDETMPGGMAGLLALWLVAVVCLVIFSSLLPGRSLQDRLARTYLVPR